MTTLRPEFGWFLLAAVVAAFLALFVSVQFAYFALLFAAVAWWTYINPEQAFLYFLLFSPLLPMFKVTQTMGNFTLVKDIIILTLFTKQFFLPLLQQTLPYRRNIFFFPILALTAWTAVSTLMADSLVLGVLRARDIVLYMMLYVAVLYLPISKKILVQRLTWLLSGLGVLLILALYQWFFARDAAVLRFDPARSIWIPRISSTFAHPSVFGEYLVLGTSFFLALLSSSKNTWRLWSVLGFATLLPFIYFTYSRGVWLGFAAACSIWFLVFVRRMIHAEFSVKKIWQFFGMAFVSVSIILFLLVQFTAVGTFLRSALDPQYASNEIRLQFVSRLLGSTSNTQALIGRGLGDVVQQNLRTNEASGEEVVSGDSRSVQLSKDSTLVDNQYLKTFIEMGLAGLLLYGWMYIVSLRHAYILTKEGTAAVRIIGYTSLGFVTAFIVQALFVDIWDVYPTNALFWVLAATVSLASSQSLTSSST